jgi:hypothetical protein
VTIQSLPTASRMTDAEYNKLLRYALDEPFSRFAIFMQRTAGYRFFPNGSPICTPRYELWAKFEHLPHQLEQLEQGLHPDFRRVYKQEFDIIQQESWISQSGSQPTTDPNC